MSTNYNNIISLLDSFSITYKEFEHEPILSYEDAEKEAQRFGWRGVESKNVFLKAKSGKYYVYVTTQGEKVDFKFLKELLGEKCSIASSDDVKNIIHCVPGCVCPFGFSEDIDIIVDQQIFKYTSYLFSPGVTTKTIECDIQDLKPVFENLPNTITFINQ